MKRPLLYIFLLLAGAVQAQYAPQAGLPGSTAISATGGQFVGWATHCSTQLGFVDIADPSLGIVNAGDSFNVIGPADGTIVSLGDSGIAVLTFGHAIYNGPGPDLAVFENGFKSPTDPAQAFLELAFVEVSSDGVHYTRFPAYSNTQSLSQIAGTGMYMNASFVNNLAGKYISSYGTPFDLQELAGTPGLDVNNITHVRVVDVIGDISGAHSSRDNAGRIINDPYPTNFVTGGFDLDAVGAINQYGADASQIAHNSALHIFPNPATDVLNITIQGDVPADMLLSVTTITGSVLQQLQLTGNDTQLSIGQYPTGMYYLVLSDANGSKWVEKVIKE